jgi:hypothetical protein
MGYSLDCLFFEQKINQLNQRLIMNQRQSDAMAALQAPHLRACGHSHPVFIGFLRRLALFESGPSHE